MKGFLPLRKSKPGDQIEISTEFGKGYYGFMPEHAKSQPTFAHTVVSAWCSSSATSFEDADQDSIIVADGDWRPQNIKKYCQDKTLYIKTNVDVVTEPLTTSSFHTSSSAPHQVELGDKDKPVKFAWCGQNNHPDFDRMIVVEGNYHWKVSREQDIIDLCKNKNLYVVYGAIPADSFHTTVIVPDSLFSPSATTFYNSLPTTHTLYNYRSLTISTAVYYLEWENLPIYLSANLSLLPRPAVNNSNNTNVSYSFHMHLHPHSLELTSIP